MGTEVHCKSHVPGYSPVMDINEDSNSNSWSLFYGDKTLPNGQYYNGFVPRFGTDGYPGYEKEMVKQKMLEHEAIFKNQVYELHRLYRVQRDMMEEVKRKELYKHRISIEASSSSSHLALQIPSDEARSWHIPSFPLADSNCVKQSILGSEVTESPLSCTKGKNSTQSVRVLSQNDYNLKDCGFSESRPLKVRKKLFDLQLPADEYIDTEEGVQVQESILSKVSSYYPTRDHTAAHENSTKLLFGGEKTELHSHNLSTSRWKTELVDLNDTLQVEEAYADLGPSARHGEIRSQNSYTKPKPQFIDLSEDIPQNSHHASINRNLNGFSAAHKGNRTGWSSYMYESGNSGRDSCYMPKKIQQEQSPISYRQTEFMLNKAHQRPNYLQTECKRDDLWTERNHGYDISNENRDHLNFTHRDSVFASRLSNARSFVDSSDLTNSLAHSVASLGNQNSQKLSNHTRPSLMSSETFSRSCQPSAQPQVISGDKWRVNGKFGFNPAFESDLRNRNGLYHGSSSSSKESSFHLSSVGYNSTNCNMIEGLPSERLINNDSRYVLKSPNLIELKSGTDLNSNKTVPRNSFYEAIENPNILFGEKKLEDKPAGLPWLKQKPVCKNAVSVTRNDQNLGNVGVSKASCSKWLKNETTEDYNPFHTHNVSSASGGPNAGTKREPGGCLNNEKIVGIPIFGKYCMSKNDSSLLVSTSESVHFPSKDEGRKPEEKLRGIDINIAFSVMDTESDEQIAAEALVLQNGVDTKINNFRNFDLNSCISEDEDQLRSSSASTNVKGKTVFEIDLEAPVVFEAEESSVPGEKQNQHESPKKTQKEQDVVVKIAAEAIVAISLYDQDHHMGCAPFNTSEASLSNSLIWFAEAICASAGDDKSTECRSRAAVDIEEFDDYEAMTLQLTETKEEDYMPKPFVPEMEGAEEGANPLTSRTRKGHTRRGRPRRDFQRDILPGIVSLSRQEVTEDIQTFGSLMRATGHQWNGGPTRRNGTRSAAARARKRCVVSPAVSVPPVFSPLMQQRSNIQVGLEVRSLTGWGKTTRRPRRQRFPAGNNLAVALT